VAVAAVDAEAGDVVLVAEAHGLVARDVHLRRVVAGHVAVDRERERTDDEQPAEDRHPGERVELR
jgi:hypothetical protein